MTSNMHDGYEVSYKKPPKAKQFKKGESGNPKGRPKKTRLKPNREHIDAQVAYMMLRPHIPFSVQELACQLLSYAGFAAQNLPFRGRFWYTHPNS